MQTSQRLQPARAPSAELEIRRLREPDGRALLLYRVTLVRRPDEAATVDAGQSDGKAGQQSDG